MPPLFCILSSSHPQTTLLHQRPLSLRRGTSSSHSSVLLNALRCRRALSSASAAPHHPHPASAPFFLSSTNHVVSLRRMRCTFTGRTVRTLTPAPKLRPPLRSSHPPLAMLCYAFSALPQGKRPPQTHSHALPPIFCLPWTLCLLCYETSTVAVHTLL